MSTPLLLFVFAAFQFPGLNPSRLPNSVKPQAPGVAQPQYTGPKGSLSGTVTDIVSGAPIRKAQVRMMSGSVVTDASGSFFFDQVPPGSYSLYAQHPDYPPSPGLMNEQPSGVLAAGEQKHGLEIKLSPAASLSGRVVDDDGDPLGRCTVRLQTQIGVAIVVAGNALTNQKGEYAIQTTPAGKYYLEARCPAAVLQPRPFAPPDAILAGHQIGYSARFYPGTRDFTSAQKIKILPGQKLQGLDFRMVPETLSALYVQVTGLSVDKQGRTMASLVPVDGGFPRANDGIFTSVNAALGEARFLSVPIGSYTLRIFSPAPEQVMLTKQTLQIGEEPSRIAVQITPPVALTGIIRMEKVETAAQNSPEIQQPSQIYLAPVGEQGMQLRADVKPDGTFTFAAISPGRYHISNTSTWVQSGTVGNEPFEGPEFDLKAGSNGPLEIKISSARGSVSGDIDIGSAKPARISIRATYFGIMNASTDIEVGDATGQPAHFSYPLPPGHYTLYAIEVSGPINTWLSNRYALTARGETVDVRSGAEATKNLKLITIEEMEKADP